MTKISVVLPTRNEEKLLPRCLRSLAQQDIEGTGIKSIEVIVVDNRSEDNTAKIAEDFGAKVVVEDREGISIARDAGVRVAKGSIIISASADAWYPKNWLKSLIQPILAEKVDASFGPFLPDKRRGVEGTMSHALFLAQLLLSKTQVPLCSADNMAFRKDVYLELGGFDTSLYSMEDVEFLSRLKRKGKRVVFVAEAKAFTSTRRLEAWGWGRFLLFHTRNYLDFALFGRLKQAKKRYGWVA